MICDYVLTSGSFWSLWPGCPGTWLVNWAVLTSSLASDKTDLSRGLWDRWPQGGLCSWADWISSLDPCGLDWSMSQPAHTKFTRAHTHTLTHLHFHPHQVLGLYLNWQLPYNYLSYRSNRWGVSLTCSALFLLCCCCFFPPTLFQALSDFLLTAVWSDSVVISQGKKDWSDSDCNTGALILFQASRVKER